jgi:acyl dehydratase
MGVATVAYVAELLEKAFPVRDITAQGSTLKMRATEPFRDGDTVTFTGQVTGKQVVDGKQVVECEITGVNQRDQTIARANASIALSS